MAAAKRPKIIVIKDDFRASDIAAMEIAPMVSGANVVDSVSLMSSEATPGETEIVHSDELNIVSARLTDKEARALAGKPGIEAVEDDEDVFAFTNRLDGDHGDLGDVPLDIDTEAAEAIEAAEAEAEDLTDEEAQSLAASELMRPAPSFDEVEFDEMARSCGSIKASIQGSSLPARRPGYRATRSSR